MDWGEQVRGRRESRGVGGAGNREWSGSGVGVRRGTHVRRHRGARQVNHAGGKL